MMTQATNGHRSDFPTLRLAHLYPSLLNVAGDGGNVMAVERRSAWRGIPTEVVPVEIGDTPDLTEFDVIFFQGGQDVEMAVAASDLERKTPALQAAAEAGVVFLAICAGLQLLGHRYIPSVGPVMKGAGVLDLETRGGTQRFMQHAACQVTLGGETETVVGFENHSGLTMLGANLRPFGLVVAGAGNNGEDGTEGAVQNNVLATYMHGPVLPKNPWLTDQIIRIALERRVGGPVELATLDDEFEQNAHKVALAKAMLNRGKRTALEPANLGRTTIQTS